MKKLILCVFLILISYGLWARSSGSVAVRFSSTMKCYVSDWDDYDDLPPGMPPSLPNTLKRCFFQATARAQFEVYNSNGTLVYQNSTVVHPNSSFVINTDNWSSGTYTLHVKVSDRSTYVFTIHSK